MATPGELVHVAAKALGIPEATVVQYDRNLVAAGLRTKGGRGRSAAQVTSRDAANLFIAIGGAPMAGASVKETRKTCERYGALRAYGTQSVSRVKSRYPTLGKLPDRHSLRDGIVALIESIAAGEFGYPKNPLWYPYVSVAFEGPTPRGSIVVDYRAPRVQLSYRQSEEMCLPDSGLHQVRSFDFATLKAVARVVGND